MNNQISLNAPKDSHLEIKFNHKCLYIHVHLECVHSSTGAKSGVEELKSNSIKTALALKNGRNAFPVVSTK